MDHTEEYESVICTVACLKLVVPVICGLLRGGADKSLAQSGRK